MALTVQKKHPTDWVCLNYYLHRRIPTNDFLLKIGRKENGNCTFCNNSSDTLIHLFWARHVTSSFWKSVTDWLQNTLLITGKYNSLNITAPGLRPELHFTEYSCQINYRLLLARLYIWQTKMDEIWPTVFIRLNAAAFIKVLAFPMRRLFKGGVDFQITFFKSMTAVIVIVCKYNVI